MTSFPRRPISSRHPSAFTAAIQEQQRKSATTNSRHEPFSQSKRNFPVTLLINSTGPVKHVRPDAGMRNMLRSPGPIPSTVREPAAICVRPLREPSKLGPTRNERITTYASRMDRAQRFRLLATASSSSSSSSDPAFNATFACLASKCEPMVYSILQEHTLSAPSVAATRE